MQIRRRRSGLALGGQRAPDRERPRRTRVSVGPQQRGRRPRDGTGGPATYSGPGRRWLDGRA